MLNYPKHRPTRSPATMHPKTLSRTLSTIAYAPQPPDGYAYIYPGARRGVTRSPLAAFLTAPTTNDGHTLTAPLPPDPTRPLPDPETLPAHYRPFPPADLPRLYPLPPTGRATRYDDGTPGPNGAPTAGTTLPDMIRANRTGDYFTLPTTSNMTYYRRAFPDYTFHVRQTETYARYAGPDAPAPSNNLPPDARTLRYDIPRHEHHTPDTPPSNFLHIYIRPDTRTRHLPNPTTGEPGGYTGRTPLPRDLDGTAQDRYLPLPRTAPDGTPLPLQPLYPFLHRHALHICYNSGDQAPDLTGANFYTPLPVLPVPHTGPAPDAP